MRARRCVAAAGSGLLAAALLAGCATGPQDGPADAERADLVERAGRWLAAQERDPDGLLRAGPEAPGDVATGPTADAVLALVAAGRDDDARTLADALARAGCDDGSFPARRAGPAGCVGDVEATARAVPALAAVDADVTAAQAWLVDQATPTAVGGEELVAWQAPGDAGLSVRLTALAVSALVVAGE